MVSDPRQTVKEASTRSWNWVRQNSFQAVPFYKRSWELLKNDWLVFLWKLIADFISRSGTFTVVMFVLSLYVVDFQLFMSTGQTPLAWIDRLIDISRSPNFIAGFVGVVGFTTLLGVTIQAFVISGIWGLLATGLRGEPIARWHTFAGSTWIHFPHVLALYLLKLAVHSVTILLATALIISFFRAGFAGSFGDWATWQQVLLISSSLTFFIGWLALTRLTLEVIGAPLIIDEMSLGDAILEGAGFVVNNFWAMYRLLIFSLGLLLIPLAGYWTLLMFNNLTLFWPILAPVGVVLRLAAELFLWVSISVLGVLFYGAVFAFYKKDDEAFAREQQVNQESKDAPLDDRDSPDRGSSDLSDVTRGLFQKGTTIEDFLPQESPHRFSADELFSPSEKKNSGYNSGDSEENFQNPKEKPTPAKDEASSSTDDSGDAPPLRNTAPETTENKGEEDPAPSPDLPEDSDSDDEKNK